MIETTTGLLPVLVAAGKKAGKCSETSSRHRAAAHHHAVAHCGQRHQAVDERLLALDFAHRAVLGALGGGRDREGGGGVVSG